LIPKTPFGVLPAARIRSISSPGPHAPKCAHACSTVSKFRCSPGRPATPVDDSASQSQVLPDRWMNQMV
jgi:hypothetical protein